MPIHENERLHLVVERLPWYRWPWNRCQAVKEPPSRHVAGAYYGRCELRPHSERIDHALERGMDTPRWSTRWTG